VSPPNDNVARMKLLCSRSYRRARSGPEISARQRGVFSFPEPRHRFRTRTSVRSSRLTVRRFAHVYYVMEKQATSYSDTAAGNNTVYQFPNPFNWREDLVRLDYTIKQKNSGSRKFLCA
jgi:hypothetical protein